MFSFLGFPAGGSVRSPFLRGEQRGGERPADFSSNSSDGVHDFLQ